MSVAQESREFVPTIDHLKDPKSLKASLAELPGEVRRETAVVIGNLLGILDDADLTHGVLGELDKRDEEPVRDEFSRTKSQLYPQ